MAPLIKRDGARGVRDHRDVEEILEPLLLREILRSSTSAPPRYRSLGQVSLLEVGAKAVPEDAKLHAPCSAVGTSGPNLSKRLGCRP